MVSTGEFLLQLLQTKVALFTAFSTVSDACCYGVLILVQFLHSFYTAFTQFLHSFYREKIDLRAMNEICFKHTGNTVF